MLHSVRLQFLLQALFLFGCQSASKPEALDLETNPSASSKKPDLADVFAWQAMFKQEPTEQQKSLLTKSVEKNIEGTLEQRLVRAKNLLVLGRYDESETELRWILSKEKRNMEAMLSLAQVYIERREINRVYQALESIKAEIDTNSLVGKKDRIRYRYFLALALLLQDRREPAHRILAEIIGEQKDFAPAYHAIAQSYLKNSQWDLAHFVLNQLLDRSEGTAQTHNLMGVIHSRQFLYTQAQNAYAKALQLDPHFVPARINMANLFLTRGELDLAEENLKKILRDSTHIAGVHVSLAMVQKEKGQFDLARASLEKCLQLDPEHAGARLQLGLLQRDVFGDDLMARRLFQEASQIPGTASEIVSAAKAYLAEMDAKSGYFSFKVQQ